MPHSVIHACAGHGACACHRVWSTASGECTATLALSEEELREGATGDFSSVLLSPDGSRVAAASYSQRTFRWVPHRHAASCAGCSELHAGRVRLPCG